MFVAALIVMLIAVLMVIAALFGGNDTTTVDLGAFNLEATASIVFFLGMGTLLLFVLSLGMLRSGTKRASAHRAERKRVSELSTQLDEYKRDERGTNNDLGHDSR